MDTFSVPILFIIFNRPDITQRTFEHIRKLRPAKLYISADGPRATVTNDIDNCLKTREVIKQIDWPCEMYTNFYDNNKGCKIGVSSAINWFFEHEEEGIILEDDCVPNDSFFKFCKIMLGQYKNDEQVMHISGSSPALIKHDESYYFSKIPQIWGWATWRRAWNKYDIKMSDFDHVKNKILSSKIFLTKKISKFWIRHLQHIRDKNVDTWDAQWHYSILKNDGVSINPYVNMIENIGFGENATHTKSKDDESVEVKSLIGIKNPPSVMINKSNDAYITKKIYMKSFLVKVFIKLKSLYSY